MSGKINIPQGCHSNESLAAESRKVTGGFAMLTGADYIINWEAKWMSQMKFSPTGAVRAVA